MHKQEERLDFKVWTIMVFCVALIALLAIQARLHDQVQDAIAVAEESQALTDEANALTIQALDLAQEAFSSAEYYRTLYEDTLSETSPSVDLYIPNPTWVECLAKVAYGEALICSKTEQAAVMWCVLNRVDNPSYPNNVPDVVTQPGQFYGYSEDNPVTPELVELAEDVLTAWGTGDDTRRVLPAEYLYFLGDGEHNHFYSIWQDKATEYKWDLLSPYLEEDIDAK